MPPFETANGLVSVKIPVIDRLPLIVPPVKGKYFASAIGEVTIRVHAVFAFFAYIANVPLVVNAIELNFDSSIRPIPITSALVGLPELPDGILIKLFPAGTSG